MRTALSMGRMGLTYSSSEPVTEYPPELLLPSAINDQLTAWMASEENRFPVVDDEERMAIYQYVLSVAPGCKLGGWRPSAFVMSIMWIASHVVLP